ncbi:transposase [Bilophila wadsworthia]
MRLFRELEDCYGCKILERHLCVDHMHMLLSIPPKYSVTESGKLGFT